MQVSYNQITKSNLNNSNSVNSYPKIGVNTADTTANRNINKQLSQEINQQSVKPINPGCVAWVTKMLKVETSKEGGKEVGRGSDERHPNLAKAHGKPNFSKCGFDDLSMQFASTYSLHDFRMGYNYVVMTTLKGLFISHIKDTVSGTELNILKENITKCQNNVKKLEQEIKHKHLSFDHYSVGDLANAQGQLKAFQDCLTAASKP